MEHVIINKRMTIDELYEKYPLMVAVLCNAVYDDNNCPIEAMVYSVASSGDECMVDMDYVESKHKGVRVELWPTSFGR